jgi:cytochrome oxidase Cu insertion factor (SCO1/SenC/PrrC family)
MPHRALQMVTGVLLGLAVVSVLFFRGVIGPGGEPGMEMVGLDPVSYPAPPLSLTTVEGDPFDLADLDGEVSLVFFGFANCPDVCPLTLLHWTRALEELERSGDHFQGVFVTVDPRRDTPEALQAWMGSFHPSFVALTGTQEELERVTADWGVEVILQTDAAEMPEGHEGHVLAEPSLGEDGGAGEEDYFVIHTTRTFVVDTEGKVVRTILPHVDDSVLMETLLPLLPR